MIEGKIKYESCADFVGKRTGKSIDMRPTDEILAEIKEAHGGEL